MLGLTKHGRQLNAVPLQVLAKLGVALFVARMAHKVVVVLLFVFLRGVGVSHPSGKSLGIVGR